MNRRSLIPVRPEILNFEPLTGKGYQNPERYFRDNFRWCCLSVERFHDEQSFHQCLPIIEKRFGEIHQLEIGFRVDSLSMSHRFIGDLLAYQDL